MTQTKKHGVLLVNLGTPEAPTAPAVKAFLGQFLSDRRVIDLCPYYWQLILRGIILPIRSPKVAKLYKTIWMDEGSPLMVYSRRQQEQLMQRLNCPVELSMTYGQPSFSDGIERLMAQGVESIFVLPLYPQYSATTTGAVYDGVFKALKSRRVVPELHLIRDYCHHPLYIAALAQSVRESWQAHGKGDYLLCSYHGIPKRYADRGDIYPKHCELTTQLLAKALGLSADEIGMTYQSRFGAEEWLQPYTDKTLETLPQQGIQHLDILSPAFSVDCLETLEEIQLGGREIFMEAGGKQYQFIRCLNDDEPHIRMMVALIEEKMGITH